MDNQPLQPNTPPDPSQPASSGPNPIAYSDLPTPQPDAPIRPVTTKKPSRKWLILVGLPFLLLGSGSVAAYYKYYQPRQTNKKVLEAIYSLADDSGYTSVKATAAVSEAGSSSSTFALDMTAASDESGNLRADMGVTYSALHLSGSIIARSDRTAYLKINELPTLLSLADSYTGAGLSGLGETIGDKWIKIDTESLGNSGLVGDSQTKEADACVAALQEVLTNERQSLMDQISKVYNQNAFLTAKKVGKESIEGQNSTKYQLEFDKTKMAGFLSSDQFELPTLEAACKNGDNTSTDQDGQAVEEELNKLTISEAYIWLGQNDKVTKLAAKLGSDGTDVVLGLTFGTAKLDASTPSEVITTDELLQNFQSLLLGSVLGGSDTSTPAEYERYLQELQDSGSLPAEYQQYIN